MNLIATTLVALMLVACGDAKKDDDKDDAGDGTGEGAPPIGDEAYVAAKLTATVFTTETKSAIEPKVLFNGTDYSLLWASDGGRELKFQRLSVDGVPVGEPKVVYSSASDPTKVVTEGRYDWAFSGERYLIALQASKVFFGVIDADGESVAPFETMVTGLSGFPAVASNGADFGAVYTTHPAASSPSHIMFRKIKADGTVGDESKLGSVDHSFNPSVAWNVAGGIYGVAWQESASAAATPEIHFASVDQEGALVTTNVAVTATDTFSSKEPVIAARGNGFGILFRDFRDVQLPGATPISGIPHIRLTHVDAKGAVQDITGDGAVDGNDDFMISSPYEEEATSPHFVQQGEEWGIVWCAQTAPFVIYFTQASAPGGVMKLARKQIISDPAKTSLRPQIASAAAGKFLTAWMGDGSQIYGAK